MQEIKKVKLFYLLMALAALCVLVFPVGIANFVFGYIFKDNPCILCWAQRISMIYVGIMAFFIVRYGLKPKYIASILIMSAFGLYQSFTQVSAHAHRDIDQGFSLEILGLHAYFWAEVVFWFVIVFLAIVFYLAPKFKHFEEELNGQSFRKLSKSFMIMIYIGAFVVLSNMFQAFISTGVPPFMGQSDPVRFSLNPRYIIWDDSELKNSYKSFSILGTRDVKAPDYAFSPSSTIQFDNDFKNAPLNIDKSLKIISKKNIPYAKPINSLSFINNEYVATSKWDIVFMDKDYKSVKSLEIDPYYSATIDPLVGVSLAYDDVYVAMGSNKTFLKFRKNDHADDRLEFANFIKGYDSFEASGSNLGRGRFSTVRAKFFHTGSMAINKDYLYLATLPNNKDKTSFVISGFLVDDMNLSFEFTPKAKLKEGRTLGDLYVTSMVFFDDKLYALSKNHNIIVVIDTNSKMITQTISFPSEIKNARSLIIDNDIFKILSFEDNQNMIYDLSF